MKVFGIQKTQTNTYSQFSQNNSANQNPVTKTNMAGDKFISNKVAFSAKPPSGLTIEQMEKEVARLQKRLDIESLTKAVRDDIEDTIDRLKIKIEWISDEGGGGSPPMGPEPGGMT